MPTKKSTVNKAGNYTKPTMRKNLFNKIKAGTKGGRQWYFRGWERWELWWSFQLFQYVSSTNPAYPLESWGLQYVRKYASFSDMDRSFKPCQ